MTYASCVLFGRDDDSHRTGVHLMMAATITFENDLIEKIMTILDLNDCSKQESALSYKDQCRGVRRHLHIRHSQSGRQIHKALVCGGLKDIVSSNWLLGFLEQSTEVSSLGRLLLVPSEQPPLAVTPRGRVICNCVNVSEASIVECLRQIQETDPKQMLDTLQKTLACGTQCGSCVPEIKQMMTTHEHSFVS